jgi:hypothetical protein
MSDIVTKIKGYRTIAFNLAVAVTGVVFGEDVVAAIRALGLSTDQAIDVIVGLVGAANIALRLVTSTPAFKKELPDA